MKAREVLQSRQGLGPTWSKPTHQWIRNGMREKNKTERRAVGKLAENMLVALVEIKEGKTHICTEKSYKLSWT